MVSVTSLHRKICGNDKPNTMMNDKASPVSINNQGEKNKVSPIDILEYFDDALEAHKDYIGDYIDKEIDLRTDKINELYQQKVKELRTKKKQNMALPTDSTAQATYDDDSQEPRTARLWTNFITRNLLLTPISWFAASIDNDNMTFGDTLVSTMLWPAEDVPALIDRYKKIKNGTYRDPKLPPLKIKYKDIKNFNDYSKYTSERIGRFWEKYGMTNGALRTTLPFIAFDVIALSTDKIR